MGLEPYRFKPFVEGAEDKDSNSESPVRLGLRAFSLSSALTLSVDLFIIYCLGQHAETWDGGGGVR